MDILFKKEIGNKLYEFAYDEYGYYMTFESEKYKMYFNSEEEKEAYRKKFEKDEIIPCWVIEYEKCPTCNEFRQVDALCGFHSTDFEETLKEYIENYQA